MTLFPSILAQATATATQAATEPAAPLSLAGEYHVRWKEWLEFHDWKIAVSAFSTFFLMLLLAFILTRVFRQFLKASRLARSTRWGTLAITLYFTLIAAHPFLMTDKFDLLSLFFHKTIVAILLVVAFRYLDRLLILPVLTRISGATPSRFIHQIILAVTGGFLILAYCSWAFGIEIGSFIAGSAVISIVLGLALQETLGNFFSGMVLQASVPFKTGDWIQVGDAEGRVIEMTWRAVTLLTNSNNHVLIPNSSVAKEKIVNYHTPSVATATTISIGLDYSIAPNDAKRVLLQAANDTEGVLADPASLVLLESFDDSAIKYTLKFWIDQPQKHVLIEQAVRVNVWYRLNQAAMNIPFPIRTVEVTDSEKKQAANLQTARGARLAAFGKIPLFAHLAPDLLAHLAAETREFSLAAGQTFYRQGDPGEVLFVLVEGTIAITVSTQDSPPRQIDMDDMSAPAIFGEGTAVTGGHRSATVRCKTDVKAIEIDRDHLQTLFTRDPDLMRRISEAVAQRQKARDEVMKQQGVTQADTAQHAPHTVLDRMRRMFNILGK